MRNLLILAVIGYRMCPERIRALWASDSSSDKALTALRGGAPILATLRRYAIPHWGKHGAKGLSWGDLEIRTFEPPSWNN